MFCEQAFFHAGSLHDVENTQVLFSHRHWVRGRDDPTTGEVCSHREYVQGQNHISHWTEFPCLDAGLTFIQNHSRGLRKKNQFLKKKNTSLVFAIQKLLDCSITSLKISQGMDMKDGVGEMDQEGGYVQRQNDLRKKTTS